MSRRSVFLAVGILVALTSGALSLLCLLVRHEPHSYVQAAMPPGPEREKLSRDFHRVFCELTNGLINDGKGYARFTQEQINSYLEEGFRQSRVTDLPRGVDGPRVVIESERIRLAFRYGTGFWSTIISVDLRVWPIENEPVVALELEGFHAGALPISAQSLLEEISSVGRKNDMDVTWYRHPENGHPVALLRFPVDQQHATLQLEAVSLQEGALVIQAKSNEPAVSATPVTTSSNDAK